MRCSPQAVPVYSLGFVSQGGMAPGQRTIVMSRHRAGARVFNRSPGVALFQALRGGTQRGTRERGAKVSSWRAACKIVAACYVAWVFS